MFRLIVACTLLVALFEIQAINGHGMMMDPVNRGSRWRVDATAPTNWNDNESYCGGIGIQFQVNGGKCGLCGDSFSAATPRPHELGGVYSGNGKIVKSYTSGAVIPVDIKMVANHQGHFNFDLCNLDQFLGESESCFIANPVGVSNGDAKWKVPSGTGNFIINVKLPSGVRCKHCVLRWTYVSGNNWGTCENGQGAMGCGPQETYKNCADISIL